VTAKALPLRAFPDVVTLGLYEYGCRQKSLKTRRLD
jgi:hypothetical protein